MELSERVVHSEPHVSPEGVAYLVEVLAGRSGQYYGRFKAVEGPRAGTTITCYPGYKTVRGAAGHAKRMLGWHEDLDWGLE